MERLLYSVRDAAERIGVCRSQLYILIGDGKLTAVKVGPKKTMITADSITGYVASLPLVKIKPRAGQSSAAA